MKRNVKATLGHSRDSYGYSDVEYLTISIPTSAREYGRIVSITVTFDDGKRRKKRAPRPKPLCY